MVISSREALRSIEKAITGTRSEEDRLTEMLRTAVDDAARLRSEQAGTLKSLARIRLDHLAGEDTLDRLDGAERKALEALERHNQNLAEAATVVDTARKALEAAEADREAVATTAADATRVVDALIDETFARMDDDPQWAAQSLKLAAAEAKALAASEKASLSETDRDEKRKPYEADRLFLYLWERGHGTSRYRATPLVRYLDGKVAALIGYGSARPNFHMLMEIPLRLREHADRLQEASNAERSLLQDVERAALVAAGIEPLEADEDTADEALQAAEDKVEDCRQDLVTASQEHATRADDRHDADLQAALEVLADEMKRDDLATLHQEALKTPSPRDEQLVQALRDIERKLERRDAEAEEVRRTALDIAKKRTQLEQSREHFRQSGFDDPRGQFADGDLIAAAIEGIIRGALSSGGLNTALRKGFRRRTPRAGGSFGGGIRSRRSGGFSSGGRSGGGAFRTGGGF